MTDTTYPATLRLNRLELCPHLGFSEAERQQPQAVWLDIALHFPHLPNCCGEDGAPFLCYHQLSQEMQAVACAKPYQLIEYLTVALARRLDSWIGQQQPALGVADIRFTLDLHKYPAVPGLSEGASFTYTTLPG